MHNLFLDYLSSSPTFIGMSSSKGEAHKMALAYAQAHQRLVWVVSDYSVIVVI